MDGSVVVLATVVGGLAGWLAAPTADAIAIPRYGPDAEGHDPEDLALAPMASPCSPRVRTAVTLAGALAGLLLADRLPVWELLVLFGAVGWLFLVASIVDLQYLRLPDVLNLAATVVGSALAVLAAVRVDIGLVGLLVGAAGYPLFLQAGRFLLLAVRGIDGLGLGDVKLAVPMGATIGFFGGAVTSPAVLGAVQFVILAALFGNLIGVIGGLGLTRFRPGRSYPFGPFLVAGWLLAVLLWRSLAA